MSTPPTAKRIEMWPLDRLVPYERNARTHSPEQVAQIVASIQEFGFTNPLLVDGADGILAGHGRLAAAKDMGLAEVPVIVLDHLTPTQRRAYILADNQLALNAGWDMEILSLELGELGELGFDLSLLGFDDEQLAELMPEVEELPPEDADADAVLEPPVDPVTQPGDIWLLEKHRLMCGDSTVITDVERLMDGKKASLVFTDPPYGVKYQSNMRTKSPKFDVLANDDQLLDIAPIVETFSTGWVFIWTSWKVQSKWIELFDGFGYPTNIVIWHKPGGGIGDLKRTFSSDYEVSLVWHRGAELCGKRIGSVWTINKDGAATYVHPTQKPVALPEEALDKTTNRGALVLDLFGGSGSTLIACKKTSRQARLMELDPRYCDVIVKRWQQFTGKIATLESTGEPFPAEL
jgi:DNA modification methylase